MTIGLILACTYAAGLLFARRGLDRTASGTNADRHSVTIIVAARNEEKNIATCLQHLLAQDYPQELLEIIAVDDRSTDGTAAAILKLQKEQSQVKLIQIRDCPANISGKKNAIDKGIAGAQGSIIMTTDADCRPGRRWVAKIVTYFDPAVGMVAGYNPYQLPQGRASFFQRVLHLDYFAMACVAAATANLGYPVSCSGGNLAYRRKVYETLGFGSAAGLASGDDDLFLQRVREETNWEIRFASEQESCVPTQPPQNFREFVQQRIRYASKGLYYSAPVRAALLATYFLNLFLVAGFVAAFASPLALATIAAAFGLKALGEFIFLRKGATVFATEVSSKLFLASAALHPFYITAAGLAGQLVSFNWKGRSHRSGVVKLLRGTDGLLEAQVE